MMFNRMFYIQRYTKAERPEQQGISRMLTGDYMGSAEFEFGSVQSSWKFLRTEEIELHQVVVATPTGREPRATFYVISTALGIERFQEQIDTHLADTRGQKTKEWTGLWERFISKTAELPEVDLWLDVSGYVRHTFSSEQYIRALDDEHPIAFTADAQLARRLFLELHAHKNKFDTANARIGDLVSTYLHPEPIKICGLNSDDSISVKVNKYAKAVKLDSRDIFTF